MRRFLQRVGPDVRLVAFEPSVSARRVLESRLGENPRVEISRLALADRAGMLPFIEEPEGGELSSLVTRDQAAASVSAAVETSTLDDQMRIRGIDRIDLLKIDAESYDLHVLRGATQLLGLAAIPVIQFEYNRPWLAARSTLAEAIRMLGDYGYEVRVLMGDGLHRLSYERSLEYFSYSNLVALAPEGLSLLPDDPHARVLPG